MGCAAGNHDTDYFRQYLGNIFLEIVMSGKTIALHRCLVGIDCKQRKTKPDTQAKLTKKQGSGVGKDCKDNTAKRGFWGRVMSWA